MNNNLEKKENEINKKWLLKERYNEDWTEKELKEIINKKLAQLIIELENNLVMKISEKKGDYNN